MIDRLIADDAEPDLVKKLLNLYNETNNVKVKNKIVQGLMIYNQRHINVQSYLNNDKPMLKAFFAELLGSKSINSRMANDVIRRFIEAHSPEEIIASLDRINKFLPTTGHYSSVMLKCSLVHKSKELQKIYIQRILFSISSSLSNILQLFLLPCFQKSKLHNLQQSHKPVLSSALPQPI